MDELYFIVNPFTPIKATPHYTFAFRLQTR